MDELEAAKALKVCITNILGKPHISVAQRFVDFRYDLLNSHLKESGKTITQLKNSPYFFRKLSINILLSAIKTSNGASLEIALGNLNTVLPALWSIVRESEKWHVGSTYRDVYTSGNSTATQGVKNALLKVQGFDFVPETIRSDTFIKAADSIIKAHEGLNNFYNELSPVSSLEKLGKVIPAPALGKCASALICVAIGNQHGTSHDGALKASALLSNFTSDRWEFYLNQYLPGDLRILNKLSNHKPLKKWIKLVKSNKLNELNIKNSDIKKLVNPSINRDYSKIDRICKKLIGQHYGKKNR